MQQGPMQWKEVRWSYFDPAVLFRGEADLHKDIILPLGGQIGDRLCCIGLLHFCKVGGGTLLEDDRHRLGEQGLCG